MVGGGLCRAARDEDLNRVVRALSTIAAESGNREALAMLARALGALAHSEGDAAGAVEHFRRALDLHREIELPHDRAELLVSAAAARATPAWTSRRASGSPTRGCRPAGSAPDRYKRQLSTRWPSSAARAGAPRLRPASRPGSSR